MGLFLTSDQLEDLTDAKRRDLQIAWLEKNGWEFEISRLGNPEVLLAYMEKRMGLSSPDPKASTEPDFTHWEQQTA
jgi:hypothetical protein